MNVSFVVPGSGARHLPDDSVSALSPGRLEQAKRAFTARRASLGSAVRLIADGVTPHAGDLLLARVIRLGQHTGLQLPTGRRAKLYANDEIIVCYGNRYAPDQFEAVVPSDLAPCHLVAGGGIAAMARHWHGKMRRPTDIQPLGLLADAAGQVLNVAQFRLREDTSIACIGPRVIAVAGTSMNAGKTTAAAHLMRGLIASGLRVAAAKVTGTGAAGDIMMFVDAGADPVVDFTDFGYASTYRVPPAEVEQIMRQAVGYLGRSAPDVIVFEVADGVYQQETAALLKSQAFRRMVSGILFAAPDSLSATAGVDWLEQRGLPVLAVSGALTASPLAIQETLQATHLPVLGLAQLADPTAVRALLQDLHRRARAGGTI